MLRATVLVGGLAVALAAACATGSGSGGGADDDDDSTGGSAGNMQGGSGGSGGTGGGSSGGGTGGGSSGGGGSGGSSGGPTLSCYSGNGACEPGDISSCSPGQTCALTTSEDWQCFDNGTSPIGGNCDNAGNPLCVMGALCVNTPGTCYQLCCIANGDMDCTEGGTCTELTGPSIPLHACL